jgi:hypothetical protein
MCFTRLIRKNVAVYQGTASAVPQACAQKVWALAPAVRTLVGLAAALLFTFVFSSPAVAETEHGILIREAVIYLSPDKTSEKLGNIDRGREVHLLENPRGEWLHVLASVTSERDITGWVLDKGVVRKSTPNGDRILYGEAVDSEAEASRRRGRKGAADDALRLYARVFEYFPSSPLAGEALYRAADIRWQLEKEARALRPSSKTSDPKLRLEIEEHYMKQVMKKFPNTKWADLAAFSLLDNKTCGDWQGQSKCPEKETEVYEKYAAERPQSPKAPEALYEAAWRQAALVEIYKAENEPGKSAQARSRAMSLAQKVTSQYAQSDWAPRAQRLAYMIEQNIPTYGRVVE